MSGLDTESLIKAATASTKNSINTKKQKLQSLQWKQEAYREVISAISNFQSKYLDILSKNSIRSNAVMKSNKAVSSNDSLVTAASSSATLTKYNITSVKTAKAASIGGTKASAGSVTLDFSKAESGENTVAVTLDGTTKNITFSGGADYGETRDNFLSALNETFKGIAPENTTFGFMGDSNKLTINNGAGDKVSHIFTVGYSNAVGLENSASNTISSSAALGSLDFINDLQGNKFSFSINGVDFSFDKDTTIKEMMNTINKSDAGVKMSFSGLSQAFTLETTSTGAASEINISQKEGNLVNALFNVDGSTIGIAPTTAKLLNKTRNDDTEFKFTASAAGFGEGDKITVNGVELGVTGLTKSPSTEKITVNGSEVNAVLYGDSDGNTLYKYTQDGIEHYAKKNGDAYEDYITVEGKTITVDGTEQETELSANDFIAAMGIEKQYKTKSSAEYADALNDAYKNAFPEGKGSFSVTVAQDGAKITFDPGEDTDIKINVSGNITADGIDSGEIANYTETPYSADAVFSTKGPISLVVDGSLTEISGDADGNVTVQDLVDSGLFSYNEADGTLSVTGTHRIDAGATDAAFDFDDAFGTVSLVGSETKGAMSIHGTNGQITVNGITLESASNTFSIDGTTFGIENVKEFTEEDIANGDAEEITVNVTKDTSAIKETILGFMEAYNGLLDTINKQLSTNRPKSNGDYFDPLTDEQKEEMDEKEIEKWEEQAKTGLLYHDTTLSKVFTQIRSAINASVGGMTIQALGIDTSSDYDEYGKLEFMQDGESKLDTAIEQYGEEIAEFFTDTENGLGAALNNAVKAAVDTSTTSRGYPKGLLTSVAGVANTRSEKTNLIYNQMSDIQKLIESLNTRYESQQERLWKQYSQLESYINMMNTQSSQLFGTTTTTG